MSFSGKDLMPRNSSRAFGYLRKAIAALPSQESIKHSHCHENPTLSTSEVKRLGNSTIIGAAIEGSATLAL